MKETYYGESWKNLKEGFRLLGVSVWHSMLNHPARFLLAVSVMVNVFLFFSMATARAERDAYNYEAVKAEEKVDSLELMAPYWKVKDNRKNGLVYKEIKK